jgi:hypothetical protein
MDRKENNISRESVGGVSTEQIEDRWYTRILTAQGKIKDKLNYIESWISTLSYKYIIGSVCGFIWLIFVCKMIFGFGDLMKSMHMILKQEKSLEFVSKYELGVGFLQDENIFPVKNSTYIRIYYEEVTYLLENVKYLSVKNENYCKRLRNQMNFYELLMLKFSAICFV